MSSFWGVDIGGSTVVIGRLGEDGRFVRSSVLDNTGGYDPGRVLAEVSSAILSEDRSPLGIGVGIAGLVDREAGILHFSPNLPSWNGLDVAGTLSGISGTRVIVDNDCNVFAWGALAAGRIPPRGTSLMITIGTGIGGTIIFDGRIAYGTGFAGEFGHMPVEAEGIPCPCGSRGCWEVYAAKNALVRYNLREGGLCRDPEGISALARSGDGAAVSAFGELGRWLGIGLSGLANCFSPTGFFLAGGLTGSWDLFEAAAHREYSSRCRHPWCIHILDSPSDAGAAGAAMMARDFLP
ncbi:ROK family protein [Candidatus Fermentibacteria bacterium]|nr:ROK family protein [Candidatus Fermentibacteria bacterium]